MTLRFHTLVLALAAAAALGSSVNAVSPEPACIAIAPPSVHGVDGDAKALSDSLRELLVSYLTGPSFKATPLEARLVSEAVEEAKQKSCGFMLVTTFTRKPGGSGVFSKVVGQAAQTAVWQLPYGATVGSAAARSAAIAGAYAVSGMAQTTRAKDELSVEYRMGAPEGVERSSAKRESLKAKSDGEDLVTPLVEKIAQAVAASAPKSRD